MSRRDQINKILRNQIGKSGEEIFREIEAVYDFPEPEPICKLGDIFKRVDKDKSYSYYQASVLYHDGLYYPVFHNLYTARTRLPMGNTTKDLISQEGYKTIPGDWDQHMWDQAARHMDGLKTENMVKVATLETLREFLIAEWDKAGQI